jgi:hypothetical protein
LSPVAFSEADPPKAGFNRVGLSEETSAKGKRGNSCKNRLEARIRSIVINDNVPGERWFRCRSLGRTRGERHSGEELSS